MTILIKLGWGGAEHLLFKPDDLGSDPQLPSSDPHSQMWQGKSVTLVLEDENRKSPTAHWPLHAGVHKCARTWSRKI